MTRFEGKKIKDSKAQVIFVLAAKAYHTLSLSAQTLALYELFTYLLTYLHVDNGWLYVDFSLGDNYVRRRLASEGIVTLGLTLSRCVCVRRISLGGEGNAMYPVLSSFLCNHCT